MPAEVPTAQSVDVAGVAGTALAALALGALLTCAWRSCASTHRRRLHGRHDAKHERLQTWEGEGGKPVETDD